MGFDTQCFLRPIAVKNYKCILCKLIVEDPIHCEDCDQLYCQKCLDDYLTENNTCYTCNQVLNVKQPSAKVTNLLWNQDVQCKICGKQLKCQKFRIHLTQCQQQVAGMDEVTKLKFFFSENVQQITRDFEHQLGQIYKKLQNLEGRVDQLENNITKIKHGNELSPAIKVETEDQQLVPHYF